MTPDSAAPSPSPEDEPARHDAYAALRVPAFRNLALGVFLFTMGVMVQKVVIGYQIY